MNVIKLKSSFDNLRSKCYMCASVLVLLLGLLGCAWLFAPSSEVMRPPSNDINDPMRAEERKREYEHAKEKYQEKYETIDSGPIQIEK